MRKSRFVDRSTIGKMSGLGVAPMERAHRGAVFTVVLTQANGISTIRLEWLPDPDLNLDLYSVFMGLYPIN